MRVLVIEDDATIADVMRSVVEDEGLGCEVCSSATDLPAGPFDVVITDLIGPVAYSRDTASAWLRGLAARYGGTPIVVVTAHTPILGDAATFPVSRVILKPFEIDDLVNAIREARRS